MTGLVSCPMCGLAKDPEDRCPSCGMTAEFGPDRPDPFAGATLWVMIGVIAALFALTLVVVVIAA